MRVIFTFLQEIDTQKKSPTLNILKEQHWVSIALNNFSELAFKDAAWQG